MAFLTTGLIKNSEICGVRPSSTLSVRISNADSGSVNIRINGFYWIGMTKKEYVLDLLTLAPGEVATSNYYALFEIFEFQFVTSSDTVEILVWGKNASGDMIVVHSVRPAELFPMGTHVVAGAEGLTIPSVLNRIYVPNSSRNTVSVIDRDSNTLITTITVGVNPVGVGVNLDTNRIYVTNLGSHNVSVINGYTDVVIATITVGTSPEGVKVDSAMNRIYITNHGSHNVSVINGSTNTVIATVEDEG